MAAEDEITRGARFWAPVRITLPVSVAFDLEKLQRALANVASSVGCPGFSSDWDTNRVHTREFVIDPASLKVREALSER
jgi:hypothetical protein